ncbi:beclin 1-associated autophagy-related key regulator isoform X2 [Folsomia candida]|uniref:beclin 1-associated autophagy-related key regulator isoform X2 n=1 Tax=Folsomia candida TaxID=158441 RepID=UPI000B8FE9FE|nr:beclin 1-associated autophagy-related key regulator isoform X2 [Folsomia candida]
MDEESCPPLEHDVIKDDDDDDQDKGSHEDQMTTSSTSTLAKSTVDNCGTVLAIYTEDAAPVDFQVPSSDSEDDENFDQLLLTSPAVSTAAFVEKVPCPLCKRKRQRLTCKECLRKGDFCVQNNNYRNAPQSKERYSELMSKFLITQRTLQGLKKQCSLYTDKKGRISKIADEIDKCQATIALQNQLRVSLHAKIQNAKKESAMLKGKTEEKLAIWPVFRKRLDNMKTQYVHSCTKLKRFHEEVQRRQENLKRGTKSRIIQLRHHVFPVEEVNQGNRSGSKGFGSGNTDSWSDEEDDTVRSLMAAKSNYWSRPDELVSSFGACYSITGPHGPTLPASGDYSAYNMWAERNQTPSGVTSGGSTHRNPAHCISAALTYSTQFVNLIAYYLDLRLPHRLSYSEFRNGDLVNGKFNKKVAKLNANVIHLCSSQGIHATSLQPRKTISNLLLLFDPEQADLGRGPFEVASQLAKSMEDSIEKDLVIYEEGSCDSDTEWNDSTFPSDWETINRAAVCEEFSLQEMKAAECASPTLSFTTDSFYRSSSANSLAGTGLLSSVTSFFRGWNK